jgi:hypothetical protein
VARAVIRVRCILGCHEGTCKYLVKEEGGRRKDIRSSVPGPGSRVVNHVTGGAKI